MTQMRTSILVASISTHQSPSQILRRGLSVSEELELLTDSIGIAVGILVGIDVGIDVGILVGIDVGTPVVVPVGMSVGMSVGGSGTTHLESTHTLLDEQHILIGSPISSNSQIPPGGTHVLPPVV